MSRGPIYIAGLERSGTSLIFALLASHPNIAMTRRTNLWTHFYNQYGDLNKLDNFERCLDMMMRYKRLLVLEPDPDRIRREFWQGQPTYGRLFSLIEAHYAERLGKPRWGDKSLNTERYAAAIFEAFPSARILHMIRDPRDRYASAVSRWKVSRGGIGAGTAMWLASVDLARKNTAVYPENYMIVRYETLAQEPKATLSSICDFIGEEYDPAMLSMQGAESFRDEGGNSSYEQREPGTISTSSIGRFRQVISSRQTAFMQARCKSDMADFNYELEPIHLSVSERLLYGLVDWPLNEARMIAWRTRETVRNRKGRPLPSYRIVSDPSAAGA